MSALHTDIQASMVAHLFLETWSFNVGGYRYWWNDGKGTRYSPKFKTKEKAVSDIKKKGFGSYRFGDKKIKLV